MSDHIEHLSPVDELAYTREQLQKLFDPDVKDKESQRADGQPNEFTPRSWTMKMLTGSRARSIGTALTVVAGLFATRPAAAMRLLRYIPVSAITKLLIARYLSNRGSKK